MVQPPHMTWAQPHYLLWPTTRLASQTTNKQKMISFSWLVQYLTGNFVVVINLYWCDDDMPVTVWRVSLPSPANVLHHPRSELARPACNLIMILYIVIVPLNISVLSRRLCLDPDINRETKWQSVFPTPNTRTRLVFQLVAPLLSQISSEVHCKWM